MGEQQSDVGDERQWRLLDQAAAPVVALDLHGRFFYANPAACRELGYDRDYLLGCRAVDITHPDDSPMDRGAIEELIASPTDSCEVEKRYVRSDGSVVWKLVTNSVIRDVQGNPLFVLSQTHNIDARRAAELRWQRTFTNAPIGMALLDLKGYWTEVNSKLCDLLGYSRDQLVGMHFTDLTYPDDAESSMEALADLVSGHQDTVTMEKRYRHKDGFPIWMLFRSSVVPGADDRPAYLVSQYESLGDPRMRDSHLAHMALHDPLTGLANRALLLDRLHYQLDELAEERGVLAVLLIDLDHLKPINDQYGHLVGDKVLTTAADELLKAVRPGDTVARLGGDEFVVLTHIPDSAAAECVRERISERLQYEIVAAGHRLPLSASVGLAATEAPTASPEDLLHCADRDMYQRKECSRRSGR